MIELVWEGVIPNTHNKRYIIDSTDELSQLEVDFGNEAYCIADKTTYICNGSGEYVEKSSGGGGGGGSDLPPVTSADDGKFLRVEGGAWVKDKGDDVARTNGIYEEMTAGVAEQLASSAGTVRANPYLIRPTMPSETAYNVGAKNEQLVGGTIVHNQWIRNGDFYLSGEQFWQGHNCDLNYDGDGTLKIVVAESAAGNYAGIRYIGDDDDPTTKGYSAGHLFFYSATLTVPRSVSAEIGIYGDDSYTTQVSPGRQQCIYGVTYHYDTQLGGVHMSFPVGSNGLSSGDQVVINNIQLIDLTQMFNREVTDYLVNYYTLPTSVDSMIEQLAYYGFQFVNKYHPYNQGELLSVKPYLILDYGGGNLLDPNGIATLPPEYATYVVQGPCRSVYYTDDYGQRHTIDITRDGIYSYFSFSDLNPYGRPVYVEGFSKNETSMRRLISGEDRHSDYTYDMRRTNLFGKTIVRRYATVDMGTLEWFKGHPDDDYYQAIVPGMQPTTPDYYNQIYGLVTADYFADNLSAGRDRTVGRVFGNLAIRDTRYATVEEFAESLRGKILVYPRDVVDATTIDIVGDDPELRGVLHISAGYDGLVYDGDTIDVGTLWCDGTGVEAWLDYREIPVPCGHHTLYTVNLRDKLQYLPELPQYNDGDYYNIYISGDKMYLSESRAIEQEFMHLTPTETAGEYESDLSNGQIIAYLSNHKQIAVLFTIPGYGEAQFMSTMNSGVYNPDDDQSLFQVQVAAPTGELMVLYSDLQNAGSENTTWYLRTYDLSAEQIDVDYASLVAMRNGGNLVPGKKYRITDYETIINGSYDLSLIGGQGYLHYAKSAGHQFDIIVTALTNYSLSEDAKAAYHGEGSYYEPRDLEAWEIKYCLDNDTSRFLWANEDDGKGVIYYMKDEHDNEAGYDFTNIQFLRYALKGSEGRRPVGISQEYTFAYNEDLSPFGRFGTPYHLFAALQAYQQTGSYVNPFSLNYTGTPLSYYDYDFAVEGNILGAIQFAEVDDTYLNTFNAAWYYTWDYRGGDATGRQSSNCTGNSIGISGDLALVMQYDNYHIQGLPCNVWECYDSTVIVGNKLGEHCFYNTFKEGSNANQLGSGCVQNMFGYSTHYTVLGTACFANMIGDNCQNNVLENSSFNNTIYDSCESNSLGMFSRYNLIGDSCISNTIGADSSANILYTSCTQNVIGPACENNALGDNSFGNYLKDCIDVRVGDAAPPRSEAQHCTFSHCDSVALCTGGAHLTFTNAENINILSYSENSSFEECNVVKLGSASYSTFRNLSNVTFGEAAEDYDGDVTNSDIHNLSFVNFEGDTVQCVKTEGIIHQVTIPSSKNLHTYVYKLLGRTMTQSGLATIITTIDYGNETAEKTTDGGRTWTAL